MFRSTRAPPHSTFAFCDNHLYCLGSRKLPDEIEIAGASDWFSLHRSFAEYAISNATFVLQLRGYFDYTLLSAESFFHVLALNSE